MSSTREAAHPNLLIVESSDDQHSVIGLMRHHIDWPDRSPWPVYVRVAGGVTETLTEGYLTAAMKAAHVRVCGVIVDADQTPRAPL